MKSTGSNMNTKPIQIKHIASSSDGTQVYVDKEGKRYYKDGRWGSETRGRFYDNDPGVDSSSGARKNILDAKILDLDFEIVDYLSYL
jgi:hypothetical protein